MGTTRILVIDDEPLMREYVEEALRRAGHEVVTASGGREGLERIRETGFDIVVTDLKMMPMDGIEVVRRVREETPGISCIVMTAYGTIETAVDALKAGAEDYILKPFAPDELELAVSRLLDKRQMVEENRYLRAQLTHQHDFKAMVGKSPAMQAVHAQIAKVADSRATVLVRGESGTGKELVAHALHHSGVRRDRPFIKVNCAALSAGLLESELFGHEKGSFTGAHERKVGRFELADTGTLLLDEVSEIAIELQPKLLRALQEREFERVGGTRSIQVDVRLVATSNRAIERAIEEGKFREDLFFRLNVIQILLPPLRERREDIVPLAEHFLGRYARENGRDIKGFTSAAQRLLLDYDWPGNVRELQNAVERAVVLSSESMLDPDYFVLGGTPMRKAAVEHSMPPVLAGRTAADVEKQLILDTLAFCGQNRTQAAKMLDISVRTLRNKLNEYKQA